MPILEEASGYANTSVKLLNRLHTTYSYCRAVLVDMPSFLLQYVARTDLGMPMDTILVTIQGSER